MKFDLTKLFSGISFLGLAYAFVFGFFFASVLSVVAIFYLKQDPEKVSVKPGGFIHPQEVLLSEGDFKGIIKRNIFNVSGKLPEEEKKKTDRKVSKPNEIKKTDLPLKIIGIIYSGVPTSGIVVIEQKKEKKRDSFNVGDILIGDAKLAEIHPKKIIIDRGTYKEFLELPPLIVKRSSRNIVKAKTDKKSRYATDPPPDEYREEGFERVGNEIKLSSEFKQKLLSTDFNKVLQDVKAVPYFEGNELQGYRMTKLKEGSIYQKMGLQANDIVREINGFVLDDASQVLNYLRSLQKEKDFEVEILRSGKLQVIRVKVD